MASSLRSAVPAGQSTHSDPSRRCPAGGRHGRRWRGGGGGGGGGGRGRRIRTGKHMAPMTIARSDHHRCSVDLNCVRGSRKISAQVRSANLVVVFEEPS